MKKRPISALSGAPPETIAFSRPPKRARTLRRTRSSSDEVEQPLAEAERARIGEPLVAEPKRQLEEPPACSPLWRSMPRWMR